MIQIKKQVPINFDRDKKLEEPHESRGSRTHGSSNTLCIIAANAVDSSAVGCVAKLLPRYSLPHPSCSKLLSFASEYQASKGLRGSVDQGSLPALFSAPVLPNSTSLLRAFYMGQCLRPSLQMDAMRPKVER